MISPFVTIEVTSVADKGNEERATIRVDHISAVLQRPWLATGDGHSEYTGIEMLSGNMHMVIESHDEVLQLIAEKSAT